MPGSEMAQPQSRGCQPWMGTRFNGNWLFPHCHLPDLLLLWDGCRQPSPEGFPSTPSVHTMPTAGLQAELSITSFQQLLPLGEANRVIAVLA